MKTRRILILAALGIAFMAAPSGWLPALPFGFGRVSGKCVHCFRDLRVPATGQILCGGCRHLMPAQQAIELYNWPAGVPRLNYSVPLEGPVPPDVTVVNP